LMEGLFCPEENHQLCRWYKKLIAMSEKRPPVL